jgi:serine protease Do
MAQNNQGFVRGAVIGLGVAAVAAVGVGVKWPSAMAAETRPLAARGQASAGPPGAPMSFADIFEKVAPAVVSINVTTHMDMSRFQGSGDGDDDEALPFPFSIPRGGRGGAAPRAPGQLKPGPDGQPAKPRKGPELQASGSGFFISADGYLVTNNHVVESAETIKVVLNDKRILTAKLVGKDEGTDLAVLKVEGSNFPFVSFETQSTPRVGDWVIAVGNPFNLGGTATAGIISAAGRDLPDSSSQFVNYLQIDAPINRGNSGGPTFDLYGKVIGVNTAIYSPSGGSVGIGFDIPAPIADRITKELMAGRKIVRGYLGVTIQNVTEDIAGSLGLPPNTGALVKDVVPGGPSEKGGIKAGDVVLAANGSNVSSNSELTRIVGMAKAGEPIHLKILRDGKTINIDVKSGVRPSEAQLAQNGGAGLGDEDQNEKGGVALPKTEVLGMGLTVLSPAARKEYALDDKIKGALIASVGDGSDAERIGLAPGDVIAKAGDHMVAAPADVAAAVADAKKAGRPSVLCLVWHKGQSAFIAIKLDPPK